jgi:hypothetical protein
MTTRHSTSGLLIPSATRFGRGRTLCQRNIAFMPRQNDNNGAEATTPRLAQRPAEHDSAPNPPCRNILARSHIGVSDRAAHPLSP